MQSVFRHYFWSIVYNKIAPASVKLPAKQDVSKWDSALFTNYKYSFFLFLKKKKERKEIRRYWIFIDFEKQYFTFQQWKHLPEVWCLWGTGCLSVGTMLNFGSSNCFFFCQSSYFLLCMPLWKGPRFKANCVSSFRAQTEALASAVPKSGAQNHLASHCVSQLAMPINNCKDVKHW